jgi:hypothetical protein
LRVGASCSLRRILNPFEREIVWLPKEPIQIEARWNELSGLTCRLRVYLSLRSSSFFWRPDCLLTSKLSRIRSGRIRGTKPRNLQRGRPDFLRLLHRLLRSRQHKLLSRLNHRHRLLKQSPLRLRNWRNRRNCRPLHQPTLSLFLPYSRAGPLLRLAGLRLLQLRRLLRRRWNWGSGRLRRLFPPRRWNRLPRRLAA